MRAELLIQENQHCLIKINKLNAKHVDGSYGLVEYYLVHVDGSYLEISKP